MTTVLGTATGFSFQQWLRSQVREKGEALRFPEKPDEVSQYQRSVRHRLADAVGPQPEYDPLDPIIHQVHERNGYRIEAVSFNTFYGLRMTATAYVPDADGPVPGVLATHGHTAHGRRVEKVQQRSASLAKHGYFVLLVDCFGSGERSVNLPGQYHGRLEGASLWLTGTSNFSIQIYENMRACDYMSSRPEVNPDRLAITGSSGGGNQAFYTGAWDERFKAIVPVVSMGEYRQMIGASNCICETPFQLMAYVEQYDVLSLIAPRALFVINAMHDSITFRHEDAKRTVQKAAKTWEVLGVSDKVKFEAFPAPHSYNVPMQEACLGWFERWLKDAPSDAPVAVQSARIEDYATVSCYPGADTPQVKTLRQLFAERRDAALELANTGGEKVTPKAVAQLLKIDDDDEEVTSRALTWEHFQRVGDYGLSRVFHTEDGLMIPVNALKPDYESPPKRVCIVVGHDEPLKQSALGPLFAGGWHVWKTDLPGLGESRLRFEVGENQFTATRACHMLGFTLAGVWIRLLSRLAESARSEGALEVAVVATGRTATPVLIGSSLLPWIDRLVIDRPLATFRGADVFSDVSMAAFIPDMLQLGDIPDFAAGRVPNELTIIGPVDSKGGALSAGEREEIFKGVRDKYGKVKAGSNFRLMDSVELIATSWLV